MIQWLPAVLTTGATALTNVLKTGSYTISSIAQVQGVMFTQNYRQKELTTRMVQMYTTDSKNVKGSLLPEEKNLSNTEKSEQIEILIHSLLNQTRAINIK